MTMQGIWAGTGAGTVASVDQTIQAYETWLGKAVDGLAVHTGYKNWSDWTGSIGWAAGLHKNVIQTHKIFWSIPLIPRTEATMVEAGNGTYNSKYIAAAQKLLAVEDAGTEPIYVRTGWEFNAYWSPASSSAVGQTENYVHAYRNFVDSFRSVSDRFVFEWTPNIGTDGSVRPEDAYPGNAYVDVIGMDFYWDSKQSWSTQDPIKAWNWNLTQPYGLNWLSQFATTHGKPIAISEWGVNSDNAAPYIEKAMQWFAANNVLYQTYWDSNSAFSGMLSNGQYPHAAAAFLEAFGYDGPELPTLYHELQLSQMAQNIIAGTAAKETLKGSNAHDALYGSGGDTLQGGKGDDTYYVTAAGDKVIELGNEGIDTIITAMKTIMLGNNIENLVMTSDVGQNATGNTLANRIDGGMGSNIIRGMGGNDWITTGAGADIVIFKKGDGHDVITDFAAGDKIQLLGFGLTHADLMLRLFSKDGNTVLMLDPDNMITFLHKNPADFKATDFYLETTTGGAGNDSYMVLSGSEVISEGVGQGIDTVFVYTPSYTLGENIENAVLLNNYFHSTQLVYGNALGNTLWGSDGNDKLEGKGGDDILIGGKGADKLTGGTGFDTFVFKAGDGADSIVDFSAGLGAGDKIRLEGYQFDSFATLKSALSQSGSSVILALGNGDQLTFVNHKVADFTADDFGFNEVTLVMPAPPLVSGAIQSTLLGTSAADKLTGDALNNLLDGAGQLSGADRLTGGKGDDTYVIYTGKESITEKTGEGIDTVNSWAASTTLGSNVENLTLLGPDAQTGIGNGLDNLLIGGDGNNLLKGENGNDALYGGAGDDILYGDAGFDLLFGGSGADKFMFNASVAFNGVDRIGDFNAGEGDKLVLNDLLIGFDPLVHAIADFVQITSHGAANVLSVDRDGAGTRYGFKAIAVIDGPDPGSEQDLLAHGTLIV